MQGTESEKPKPPLTPFKAYLAECDERVWCCNPHIKTYDDLQVLMDSLWEKMPIVERRKYKDMAAVDDARYRDEMKMWAEQ